MDIDRLQEFVIIAQKQSIKKAAEMLHTAPTTLKSRLNTLEASLGTSLFLKSSGQLILTPEGSRFYKDASDIVSEYQNLTKSLLAPEKYFFHHLRIAMVEGSIPIHLGPFLDILNRKNPQIHLELLDDTKYSIMEGLNQEKVDLYFAPAMNSFLPEGITKYALFPSQQYILLPTNHRLASRHSISLRDLDGESFILYPETAETCIRDFQIRNLESSGIRYSICETRSSAIFNRLFVTIGKGLLISPIPIMEDPPKSVCLPLTDVLHPASISLFYRKTSHNPETLPFVDAFKQFIRENQHYENGKAI